MHSKYIVLFLSEIVAALCRLRELQNSPDLFPGFFFFLSERTPLERCCVHNMSPFVSSSGLSPGSREAKVQRPRSASVARSQVWLGLPAGRLQSGGTCRIHAARAQWWSSRAELRAIWPKSCRHLLVLAGWHKDLYFIRFSFCCVSSFH